MNSQNQNGKVSPSKSKGRGCLIWLGRIMISIMGLSLLGYIFEPGGCDKGIVTIQAVEKKSAR